jgi:prephenate dehydrogenase
MTRVAWLQPEMWSELFLENRENLLRELDSFLGALEQYRAALENRDGETLRRLLEEGCKRKKEIDG